MNSEEVEEEERNAMGKRKRTHNFLLRWTLAVPPRAGHSRQAGNIASVTKVRSQKKIIVYMVQ